MNWIPHEQARVPSPQPFAPRRGNCHRDDSSTSLRPNSYQRHRGESMWRRGYPALILKIIVSLPSWYVIADSCSDLRTNDLFCEVSSYWLIETPQALLPDATTS